MNCSQNFAPSAPEKVELFLSCRNLPNSQLLDTNLKVKLYIEEDGMYTFYDQTERIERNFSLTFIKTFILDYYFEVSKKLKFEFVNEDDSGNCTFVGEVLTTLGSIIGASRSQIDSGLYISNKLVCQGKLMVKYEKIASNNQMACMEFRAHISHRPEGWLRYLNPFSFFGSNTYVLKLLRITNDFDYVQIYESEVQTDNENPEWKPTQIKVSKLCNSDNFRPVKAQIYTRNKSQDTLVGESQFTFNDLTNGNLSFSLTDPFSKKQTGVLTLTSFQIDQRFDFLDYIRGGTQLNVMVGIDFTASNGEACHAKSLHSLKFDGTLNEYQQAISSVCDILLDYDYDKKVPVYGFGGKPEGYPGTGVQHCFSLTGDPENPWVSELAGIMHAYSNALQHVELAGPTLFSPMLQQAMKMALENKRNGSKEYIVFLIITDGEIHDMEATINCLIRSAGLPLSVIIVGVGTGDFGNMNVLDGDNGLCNSQGESARRDLVQFVPFRDFKYNPKALARHVLEEVPRQLVDYMMSQGICPEQPVQLQRAASLKVNQNQYPDLGQAPEQLVQSVYFGATTKMLNFAPSV